MATLLTAFIAALQSIFRTRAALQLENLALRHRIGVLRRSAKKRPKLAAADLVLWVWLCGVRHHWRSALVIVKPETVIAWHRQGFRLFWTWKIRHGQPGRPAVPRNARDLIRRMSREKPLWGAPRIHGELLKLGIDVWETSVRKYMVRHRRPPSQMWQTFLENHVRTMVSVDCFTVLTLRFQTCTYSWCWLMTGVESSISTSPPTRLRNGGPSNSAMLFHGTLRRVICCGIVTASPATTSRSRSRK